MTGYLGLLILIFCYTLGFKLGQLSQKKSRRGTINVYQNVNQYDWLDVNGKIFTSRENCLRLMDDYVNTLEKDGKIKRVKPNGDTK